MANTKEKKHIAVYVFPFGGHQFGLLGLLLKLAQAAPNLIFSIIATEQSNKVLSSKPNIPNNIKFYTIDDGIPEGHAIGHPVERLNLFIEAGTQNLQKGIDLAEAETKHSVSCIISDAFLATSLNVAQKLNVPWIAVWISFSCCISPHFYTDMIRQRFANNNEISGDTPLDFLPGLSKMRVEDLPEDVIKGGEDETLFSKTLASLGRVLPEAKAVVLNNFEELDPPLFVEELRSKLKALLYVGFFTLSLPPPPLPPSDTDETGCTLWLDMQKERSAAYVSFGTVVTPSPHEILAMAEALEESGFPFLWSSKDPLDALLPSGFLERTKNVGKIVPWAPQSQVLGHGSVGVFVTHSGTNSVVESISNGVPMICRPFFADQWMTARMVADIWECGVTLEGGVFTKNGFLKSLNLVLVKEEGKKIRENAVKVKRTVLDAAEPQGKAAQDFKTLVELVSS